MASFADLRPIIVISCFLSLFLFFTTQMAASPEIWNGTYATRINPTDDFTAANLLYWNMTNGTLIDHDTGWTQDAHFGDVEIKLYTYQDPLVYPVLQIDSYSTWSFGVSYQHSFEHFSWYLFNDTSKSTVMSHDLSEDPGYMGIPGHGIRIDTLDELYAATSSLSSLRFFISNSRTSSNAAFTFNTTYYASPYAAWVNDALAVTFDNNYSEVQSGLNAFNLISGLLFWTLPGVPVEIFALIAFIVWPPIIYVSAIWVLRIIGSVFGGGASG